MMDKIDKKWAENFPTEAKEFAFLCMFTQEKLKAYLFDKLIDYGYDPMDGKGFLYARGTIPVLLTAHMDTTPSVRYKPEKPVTTYVNGLTSVSTTSYSYSRTRVPVMYISEKIDENGEHIYESPQGIGGDDRCGIYAILKILELGFRPYVLFNEDEEIGCVGSDLFAKSIFIDELKKLKFFIQIDRRGYKDAVFYRDENTEFHEWVEEVTGFKEATGSCTDIVGLTNATDVASVNLSSGYYDEHTEYETVCIEDTLRTVLATEKLLNASENVEQFEFKPHVYTYRNYGGYYGDYYDSWYSRYYKNYGGLGSLLDDDEEEDKDEEEVIDKNNIDGLMEGDYMYEITYYTPNLEENTDFVCGDTPEEALGKFFIANPEMCYEDVVEVYLVDEAA